MRVCVCVYIYHTHTTVSAAAFPSPLQGQTGDLLRHLSLEFTDSQVVAGLGAELPAKQVGAAQTLLPITSWLQVCAGNPPPTSGKQKKKSLPILLHGFQFNSSETCHAVCLMMGPKVSARLLFKITL